MITIHNSYPPEKSDKRRVFILLKEATWSKVNYIEEKIRITNELKSKYIGTKRGQSLFTCIDNDGICVCNCLLHKIIVSSNLINQCFSTIHNFYKYEKNIEFVGITPQNIREPDFMIFIENMRYEFPESKIYLKKNYLGFNIDKSKITYEIQK